MTLKALYNDSLSVAVWCFLPKYSSPGMKTVPITTYVAVGVSIRESLFYILKIMEVLYKKLVSL